MSEQKHNTQTIRTIGNSIGCIGIALGVMATTFGGLGIYLSVLAARAPSLGKVAGAVLL